LVKIKKGVEKERIKDFKLVDGVLRFRGRLCIPNVEEIKKYILREAHHSAMLANLVVRRCTKVSTRIIGGVE